MSNLRRPTLPVSPDMVTAILDWMDRTAPALSTIGERKADPAPAAKPARPLRYPDDFPAVAGAKSKSVPEAAAVPVRGKQGHAIIDEAASFAPSKGHDAPLTQDESRDGLSGGASFVTAPAAEPSNDRAIGVVATLEPNIAAAPRPISPPNIARAAQPISPPNAANIQTVETPRPTAVLQAVIRQEQLAAAIAYLRREHCILVTVADCEAPIKTYWVTGRSKRQYLEDVVEMARKLGMRHG